MEDVKSLVKDLANNYTVVNMGALIQEMQRGLLTPSRTFGITGKPGVAKTAIVENVAPQILAEFYGKALPLFYEEAQKILDKHTILLGHSPVTVSTINKCLADFKGKHELLRVAYDWLEYCADHHHPVEEIVVDIENFRLSQIDSTMLRGYPDKQGGRMIYIPDVWMPINKFDRLRAKTWDMDMKVVDNGRSPLGILVMDEANRGKQETQQASFQLFEKGHRCGMWSLKSGWCVVACMNVGSDYDVSPMDGALVGRMSLYELRPDFPSWDANFASKRHPNGHPNLHPWIRTFIKENPKYLIASDEILKKAIALENKYPSLRDWTALSDHLYESLFRKRIGMVALATQDDPDLIYKHAHGAVGNESALAFSSFCRSAGERVEPADVIGSLRYGDIQAEELVAKIKGLNIASALDLVDSMIEYSSSMLSFESYDYLQWSTIFMLLFVLPEEVSSSAYKSFMTGTLKDTAERKAFTKAFRVKFADWFTPGKGTRGDSSLYPEAFVHPITGEALEMYAHIKSIATQALTK